MMITRRSFLQALLSLPVVAAIPQFEALAKALPVVEPEIGIVEGVRFHESWLRINGEPVECASIAHECYVDEIDVVTLGSPVLRRIPGLQHNRLTARIYLAQPSSLFYMGEALNIEARFGSAVLRATGYLRDRATTAPPCGIPYSDITVELMRVRYEDSL